jgi:2-methylcitrate dehydratase PrpD
MHETLTLAAHSATLRFRDLPPAVVSQARAALQDCLGVALFVGAHTPWGQTIRRFALAEVSGSIQVATIVGVASRTTAGRAALANGTCAQGFEFEDVHVRSPGHPECCVVPAALATAEFIGASGEELLTAIVAGCEVMVRVGLASGRDVGHPTVQRGLFPHPLYGIFGAAASAARILGLDAERTAMVLGLAGEQAYGSLQSTAEGAWSKRWQTGRVDEAAVNAALLVREGFVGPRCILEGEFGLYRAHRLDFDPVPLVRAFEPPFEILDLWFKRYPCWGVIQGAVDAALSLKQEQQIDAAEVAWVEGAVPRFAASPFLHDPAPDSVMAAQTSLPYCLAVAMLRGRLTPDEFREDVIRDPVTRQFARQRVRPVLDEALELRRAGRLDFGGRAVVGLADGRVLTREVDVPRGHPRNPMTPAEMEGKFMNLARGALGDAGARQLRDAIQGIEHVEDVRDFTALLRPSDRSGTARD